MKVTISVQAVMLILLGAFAFSGCNLNGGDTTYAIGDTGPSGIGIVFYVTDGGLHGLEVAPDDQSTGAAWSTITDAFANGSIALPDGIGTGSENTDAIIVQNSGDASAAKICRDYTGGGKTDWFLPSKDELNELYTQKEAVGGFSIDWYWSSSELSDNPDRAKTQYFNDGTQGQNGKSYNERVRAVRAF